MVSPKSDLMPLKSQCYYCIW